MARGKGRPRKQVKQQRLSSSLSSKGSVNGASSSHTHEPKSNPDAPNLENEILRPRSSIVQLQTHNLYSNWAAVVNGGSNQREQQDIATVTGNQRAAGPGTFNGESVE